MTFLVAILILIIFILGAYIVSYKQDIKYMSQQIKNGKGEFNSIKIKTLDKDIEKLALSINAIYELNNKNNLEIRNRENELRVSIANISHDLRTPLTSIMGYIELMNNDSLTSNEKAEYIQIIKGRTEILQGLITSFYDLSRVDSNEYKFDLKPVNLREILFENIALFFNDFSNKGIEPNIDIEENIPNIISDESALMRIFSNLTNNILKHGGDYVSITLKKENDIIITEFGNDAPNLRNEDMEHLFDRFYTGDLTRNDNNTGLGLYIVKTLVEKLGYRLEASLVEGVLKIKIVWNK